MPEGDFRVDESLAAGRDDAALAWHVIEPLWEYLYPSDEGQHIPEKRRRVTEGQIAVFAVTWVERDVLNGGLQQYFYNPPSYFAKEALEGFRKMEASAYADVFERALAFFPDGSPPRNRTQRMKLVGRWRMRKARKSWDSLDGRLFELFEEDDIYKYIAAYVRKHTDWFFRVES